MKPNKEQVGNIEQERKEILNAFRGLMRAVKNRSKEETKLIRKAFDIALDAHKDMRRKSGEPYIYHPISVARICADEMDLDAKSVVCALLHDTVEDTYLSLKDIEEVFGKEVSKIIDGLTKIPEVFDENASVQAENFRKMILTISDDFRVVLIKLADRLHNMRTLSSMRADKQLKIASETQFLYAPLAHRLGLYSIKGELEDLSLTYTDPDIFKLIESKLKSSKEVRNRFIRRFMAPIKEELKREGYVFKIKTRTKSIASIWRKMKSKGIPFEEVFDLFAIRIIIDTPQELEKPDCWRIYSIVTDFYQPSPERLRDWISTPRANGYESLHTTVMSPKGKWVEVQIRSERMDVIAEKGFAAHYRYKESSSDENKFDRWISDIRDLLESADANAIDFVNEFKLNLFKEEIYIFTPKGDLRVLPTKATVIDFAYDIHTEVGNKCIGGKVNNKLVPLSYQLQNGDQLEIITSSKQKPHEDWLKIVISARAKQKIKYSLNEERRKIAEDGKEILDRKFKQFNLTFNSENVTFLVKHLDLPSATEFYFRIAKGKIDFSKIRSIESKNGRLIKQTVVKKEKETPKAPSTINSLDKKKDTLIIGENFKGFDYQMAKCCSPIPGDKVFGFITIQEGIKIHRYNCPNAENLMSKMAYRCIGAKWKSQELIEREVSIKLLGIDSLGLVNGITEIISKENHVNMKGISFDTDDGVFTGVIKIMIFDTIHLDSLIKKLKNLEGIEDVSRFEIDQEIN
mgnify:CR=1 FL=1